MQEIANKYQVNIPQLIIRWLLQQEIVCIPKSEKPERIIENANVFHFEISEEDMKRIDNMNEDFHCTWNPYEIE
ncbi:Glyoxal reductase [compost metagenome]